MIRSSTPSQLTDAFCEELTKRDTGTRFYAFTEDTEHTTADGEMRRKLHPG